MVKTIEIVSLSSGVIGESFVKHELEIGLERLEKQFGLKVKFSKHALSGIEYIKAHPEKRAEDLINAFRDESVDMILTAIGGDDTYRLLPYLFGNDELKNALTRKIFLGFSDTTVNHLMLAKLGLPTFYGQAFLCDLCELESSMLPYTEKYFSELITTGRISCITPSEYWYEAREDYSASAIGTALKRHDNGGFELISGNGVFSGKILGGCIDSIFELLDPVRYPDSPALCESFGLFPPADEWQGKILLLESSEELMPPEKYAAALEKLRQKGVFNAVSGVLVGKPMNGVYEEEYKRLLLAATEGLELPILCNLSIGHALPRCIIPFGVEARVDALAQRIDFFYDT